MVKKLFSFIHGESLHVAPKTKVISAQAFSDLLQSQEMLEKVKSDADRYVEEVTAESEKLKEKAAQEGFEEGMRQWVEKIVELEKEIAKVHDEVHKLVIPVALNAAKKIVGREIELNHETVVDIVAHRLKAVTAHTKIKIFVNREDLSALEKNKDKLRAMFENLESLAIIERNEISPGGCVIETEGGIINAQLENLWKTIEEAFQSMMSK
ncbi:MAG: HrpE/YscL family type III secretion apparatus protein [Chlamydiales bacterium]